MDASNSKANEVGCEELLLDSDDDEILLQALDEEDSSIDNGQAEKEDGNCCLQKKEKPVDWIKGYRTGLSVSDLLNQFWCEQQFEYSFTHPISKPTPEIVTVGAAIHRASELEVHDIVKVHLETKEDSWAIKLLNMYQQLLMLSEGDMVREVEIFGTLWDDDILINGIIDEIRLNDDRRLELRELKTRSKRTMPSNAIQKKYELQVMIYQKLLCDLIVWKTGLKTLKEHIEVNWDLELNEDVKCYSKELFAASSTLNEVYNVLQKFLEVTKFQEFGSLFIEYCYQTTTETIGFHKFDYNEIWLREVIEKQFTYLLGNRACTGVDIEEAWKCHACDYQDICSWRIMQERKFREKNELNFQDWT